MGDVLGELEIRIRAKLDDLDKDFGDAKGKAERHVDDIAEKTKSKIGGALKSVAGIGAAVAGAFAVVGAGKFLGGALSEMEEAVKTGKQTEAVIKSTGGAANITASQVGSLADSLSAMSGIDDETVQAGENMLLTFTEVQNRVGKGNDIFNQATKTMLDMSVALGQDTKTSAIQLGKALNDPIKGVTALQRVGVTFTEEQKKQIAAMVESGNVAGAQKVILAELNKEFGGSAKAQATATDKMKVAWANLQESAGMAIAPMVGGLANLGARVLPKVASGVQRFGQLFTAGLSNPLAQFDDLKGPERFIGNLGKATSGVKQLAGVLFTGDFKGGGPFQEDSPLVDGVFKFRDAIAAAVGFVVAHWPQISAVISNVMGTVVAVISGVVDVIMTIWHNFGSQITTVIQAVFSFIVVLIEAALQVIRGIIKVVTGLIHGDWSAVWDGIKQIFGGVWDAMVGYVEFAMGVIPAVLSAGWEIVKAIFGGVVRWIGDRIDDLVGFFTGLPGRIASAVAGMWDGIKDAFRAVINTIIGWWNGLQFHIPGFSVGPVHFGGFTLGVPDIPYLAKGGIVTRPTLAFLGERGPEAVVPLGSGYNAPRDRIGSMGGGDAGGAGGNVNVYLMGDAQQMFRVVRTEYQRVDRNNVDSGLRGRQRRR